MGGRVDGKKKKKSSKANVTSKFSSKRKLSRMGKKVKKGMAGAVAEYITRSAALRKLQITLKDFRRLCILKGIYPRVPPKAPKGGDKVYYDIKDISYIMHEPLLEKFREFKAFMKKIRRAAGRNQFDEARRKNDLKPKISLDHLVKERYPRFIDALRDLDDALCMIHLFAMLPSSGRITPERSLACNKLSREWQYYVSKSKTLRKVFVSVKGVYYQAEIMGEPVTWLAPHPFTQSVPKEVDFRVMLTFLEFYEVFVKFVLYKLFHTQEWQYPPVVDATLDAQGSCLLALRSENTHLITNEVTATEESKVEKDTLTITTKPDAKFAKKLATLPKVLNALTTEDEDEEDDEYTGELAAPLQQAFSDLQNFKANPFGEETEQEEKTFKKPEVQQSSEQLVQLFAKFVFFLNREIPLDWLQLCTTAFGGMIGWDGPGSPITVDDARITHHVVDRPVQGNSAHPAREYIQPQWVFDSINAKMILPTRLYAPSAKLPPHLSPFVDDDREGYVPTYRSELKKLQTGRAANNESNNTTDNNNNADAHDAEANEEEEEEGDDEEDYANIVEKERNNQTEESDEEDDDEEESDEDDEEEVVEELEEVPTTTTANQKGPKAIVYRAPAEQLKVDEKTELKELSKQMMTKKTKRLYDRMQHGIAQKKESIQQLENKRKALEADSSQPPTKGKKAKKA